MRKHLLIVLLILLTTGKIVAQNISGTVVDQQNEPLPGVSVVVKGTTIGMATDVQGKFEINVPNASNKTLVFSFMGYKTQEHTIGRNTNFNIVLEEDTKLIDEVVVIGYGVQKKSLVSGAIGKVTSEDLNRSFPTRFEDVLNGKVAGLTIMQNSGQPNDGSAVYVRGIGTTGNAGPLYIVDGVQIDGNISFLNPADIASVEVLKDAASAAIYGTRGANGVILISTKTGSKGKTALSYDVNIGWQNPWKKEEILNAQEYMTLMNESAINDGGASRFSSSDIANAKTTDWQDKTFNYNAPVINHNVSITGGTDLNTYAISYGYFKQDGIVGGNYGKSNIERHNFRINDSYTAFQTKTRNFLDKLTVGVNAAYTHDWTTGVTTNSEFGSPLGSALVMPPYLSVYADDPDATLALYPYAIKDKDGRVYMVPAASDKFQEIGNPVAQLDNQRVNQKNMEDVIVGAVWAELQIMKGLKFRSSYSIDMSFWGNDGYHLPYYIAPQGGHIDNNQQANVYGEKNRRFYWQSENYFTYDNTFAGKHSVQVVLGQSASKSSQSRLYGLRSEPLYDDPNLMYISNTSTNKSGYDVAGNIGGGNVNFYARASYFGRINYNFAERYIFSASYRRDGSTRFGPDSKWGNFPAFSLAWNILNEPYIGTVPTWMNAAKVRVSWGRNGNDNIGELRYMTNYATGGAYNYYFGGGYDPSTRTWMGTLVTGLQPGALENNALHWEQSEQTNAGFDLLFLKNALNVSFDWFTKKTIGMLQTAIIPPSTGQGAPVANVGTMSNKGVEFEIGYKGRAKDFNWNASVNASHVNTILVNYANANGIQTSIENQGNTGVGEYMRGSNGQVYPYFYGLKTNGIFQNQDDINNYTWTNPDTGETNIIQPNAKPGDIRFVDRNNDGKISDDDKTKIGKPMPDWTFGITLGANWKGFDLNFFFKSALGFQIFDYAQRGDVPNANRPAWVLDRWHGEGTSNTIPRMTAANPNGNYNSSDLYLKDGSYLRLKTAQLGYTLPASLTQKIAVQKLRFYVSAYNLLTFTGYQGFDIEMGSHSVDRGVYPQSRTIAVGANITF